MGPWRPEGLPPKAGSALAAVAAGAGTGTAAWRTAAAAAFLCDSTSMSTAVLQTCG